MKAASTRELLRATVALYSLQTWRLDLRIIVQFASGRWGAGVGGWGGFSAAVRATTLNRFIKGADFKDALFSFARTSCCLCLHG